MAELRSYQTAGVTHLTQPRIRTACLWDDMGLGKTVQALAAAERIARKRRAPPGILAVVPRVALQNWAREVCVWAPSYTSRS